MIRYWEIRRIWYNLALLALVAVWVAGTWPHFRAALNLEALGKMLVLAVLANICYCAAYLVDFAVQSSDPGPAWLRWRIVLWAAGTLFALFVACYWIGDEIYPDFSAMAAASGAPVTHGVALFTCDSRSMSNAARFVCEGSMRRSAVSLSLWSSWPERPMPSMTIGTILAMNATSAAPAFDGSTAVTAPWPRSRLV